MGLLPKKLQLLQILVLGSHEVIIPQKRKLTIIADTVRDRVKQSPNFDPLGFAAYKITTFENLDFEIT